jgi:hypothetical protein
LRTLASPKGDGGRDATIFSKKSSEDVAFQYSVTMDWNGKILATARRLSKTYPDTRLLVYVTNKTIGAQGDQLKTKLLEKFGLVLDIHDSHWFLDRYRGDVHLELISEDLAKEVVDPFLQSAGVIERTAPVLTGSDAQSALVFLQLQYQDDAKGKGQRAKGKGQRPY